jgi:hypothetical protein
MLVKRCFFSSLVIAVLAFSVLSVMGADPGRPATPTVAATNGGLITVTAPTVQTSTGMNIVVSIAATDTTGLGVTGFNAYIRFDPAVVTFQGCSLTGTVFSAANAFCNPFPTPDVIAAQVNGTSAVSGAGSILRLNFLVIGTAGQSSPLNFVDFYFNEGDPASVTNNGIINLLNVTAAGVSVSGRLLTNLGRPVSRASVSMIDTSGNIRTAYTNTFGYFRFEDVTVGENYVINATAKGYRFTPMFLNLMDQVSDLTMIAER